MFRGSAPAKIDDRGRLKLPVAFRRLLEDGWGDEVFVTSVLGDSARLYPLAAWEAIEAKIAALPSTDRSIERYLERVAYFGQQGKLDAQGRIVLPLLLRESAGMEGEVVVSGHINYLVVWNRERFERRLEEQPFTEDDSRALSERGI